MKMTTEEAFVKTLQRHGIDNAFGIIGSAFMPISDYFPAAGITFWDVAHECNGGYMADGFARTTGRMAMIIAQNGPGITNFVTAVKTAYWNHTPMLWSRRRRPTGPSARAVSRKSSRWPPFATWWPIRKRCAIPRASPRC